MKISLEWLQSYLPGPLDPHKAGDALTNGGLPVEVFEKHGDDDVIDVEVTSNRGDCLSHVGVARELSALLDRPFQGYEPTAKESAVPAASAVAVRIDAKELCPHYIARVIRGVKIGPSPAWMVRRLEAVGLRSINNIVDVTNYVMFEMGQPLHAFDHAKIAGGKINVRRAAPGEKLISLDGKEHTLEPGMLVIADEESPVALAGIMGGLHSEVTAATTTVLLEAARFEPLVVRKTARALAMKSDSSYRFERGIDPTLPARASLRAAQLILEIAGGELLAGTVEAGASGYSPRKLVLRLAKLRNVLGVELTPVEVMTAFKRLAFPATLLGDRVEVTVPHWRLDVNIETDLVEEVARVVGYDRIPMREAISVRLHPADPAAATMEKIRQTLIAAGYFEAITFSFVTDSLALDFQPKDAAGLPRADAAVRKADARLRPSILPGLLEAIQRNEYAGSHGAKLFETGSAFWADATGRIIERRRVGLVGSSDLREVRGAVEELLHRLDSRKAVNVVPDAQAGYADGACGRIEWDGKIVGFLGKIDRKVAEKLSLRDLPCGAELELEALLAGARPVPTLAALPKFPGVERDLSLVVAEKVRYEQLRGLVHGLNPEHLENVEYVTTYRGKPLEKGLKSVTMKLVFRASERTLTGDEVEGSVKRIVDVASKEIGAALRV